MSLLYFQEHNNPHIQILGFTVLDATTELKEFAVNYVLKHCGVDRANNAFEMPEKEGMYLIQTDTVVTVFSKQLNVTPAGWFSNESVTWNTVNIGRLTFVACDLWLPSLPPPLPPPPKFKMPKNVLYMAELEMVLQGKPKAE